jgi:prophage regulatory protein
MQPDRILREAEVRARTGLSRTTRWRLIRSKEFPMPVGISRRAVGWRETEIQAWVESRSQAKVSEVYRHAAGVRARDTE